MNHSQTDYRLKFTIEELDEAVHAVVPLLKNSGKTRWDRLTIAAIECFLYPERHYGIERAIIRAALLNLRENGHLVPAIDRDEKSNE